MYSRILDIKQIVKHKSLFLFGPRQTGKSTLLKTLFPEARYIDLLEADTFRRLSSHPEDLRQTLSAQDKLIIIDEVQKLPSLLNEAQLLIDRNKDLKFIFTGSSARKLKRGRVNLLGGRAWFLNLFPLVSPELNFERLVDRLNIGSLPSVIDSPYAKEDLKAYVGGYLQEEIKAEGLSRSIENFSRFLEVAALTNTEQVNYTSVASDLGMPPRTLREYYKILEDTLIGSELPPYGKTIKRKPVATAKFYFFDIGVANVLTKRGLVEPNSELYGKALEHLIFLELKAYLAYNRIDEALTFWRTQSKFEVDFIVEDRVAIEVKSGSRISRSAQKGLLALSEEVKLKRKIVVSNEPAWRKDDNGIEVFPVELFLKQLWNNEILV